MCSSVSFNAICGSDGKTYYSPCHAGCTTSSLNNQTATYVCCKFYIISSLEFTDILNYVSLQIHAIMLIAYVYVIVD